MLFKAETRDGVLIGHSLQTKHAYFFLGTRHFTKPSHAVHFPRYKFAYLKQVHGRTVLEADPAAALEADAHFTHEKGIALVSQTADCTPILLANDRTACAIHSGWRGTELNITGETARVFADRKPALAVIGPHILRTSFEVGDDVAARLKTAPGGENLVYPHPTPGKKFFDLSEMVRRQLRHVFGADLILHELLEDTVTNPLYHSYRRDGARAGRQYSFVVLNPEKGA